MCYICVRVRSMRCKCAARDACALYATHVRYTQHMCVIRNACAHHPRVCNVQCIKTKSVLNFGQSNLSPDSKSADSTMVWIPVDPDLFIRDHPSTTCINICIHLCTLAWHTYIKYVGVTGSFTASILGTWALAPTSSWCATMFLRSAGLSCSAHC